MNELSVQVPVRDGGEQFSDFLRSLARQDLDGNWELVIADDGSRSPVEVAFSRELGELPDRCVVRIVSIDPGGNRPAARNAALEASDSQYALLMDADLEFGPGLLSGHLEALHRTGSDAVMGRRVNAWSACSTPWQAWMDSRAMGDSPPGPFPWKYFITGNLSVRTVLLREVGGFDEAIDRYGGEDTEIGYRLASSGAVFHWEPSLSVNHLDDVTVRKHSMKMLEYGSTGLRYTLDKHPGTRGLLGSRWAEPLCRSPLYLLPVRLAVRAALSPAVYRRMLVLAEERGGPRVLFTYLSVGACLMGLMGRSFQR